MKKCSQVVRWIGGIAAAVGLSVGVFQVEASSDVGPMSYDAEQTEIETRDLNGPASYKIEEQAEKESSSKMASVETEESLDVSKEAEPTEREVAEEEIDQFFKDSVFVGDSVMVGFRNYAMRRQDTYLANMQFLAAGSLSAHNAFWEVSSKSVHPVYQGQKRLIWDSIALMQAKKVFLFFGLNDLNISGVEGSCEKYKELIGKILETSPDVEIHILSMTYTLNGKGKGKLNNDNIRQFNEKMHQIALENGWGFVDLATPLSDETGGLAAVYCSDQYVHQTSAAYDVWSATLREYARNILKWTPQPQEVVTEETAAETAALQ